MNYEQSFPRLPSTSPSPSPSPSLAQKNITTTDKPMSQNNAKETNGFHVSSMMVGSAGGATGNNNNSKNNSNNGSSDNDSNINSCNVMRAQVADLLQQKLYISAEALVGPTYITVHYSNTL